jgi:hypothetical protein
MAGNRNPFAGHDKATAGQYQGVTAPKIPRVPETEPTFSRQGSHVLVGRSGNQLKPNFVSSHKTKQSRTS